MLRTIELILGLKPLTQFDLAARPLYGAFRVKPALKIYHARMPSANQHETNVASVWGVEQSAKMNFAKEDAVDDLLLNEVIWHSVRGPQIPMPPPVRAAFVFSSNKDDDDD